jgi:putative membrane protein
MTRMHRVFVISTTVVLGGVVAACSLIEETLPGVTLSDSNVMSVLDGLGKAEIDAARLAQQKAATPEVRAFAGRVLKEHRELDEANRNLAAELSVEPKTPLVASQFAAAHEDGMRTLRAASGPAFDRAYVTHEIQQHVRAFNFVQAAAETEGTPELRQELVRTGPDLLSHISAARALSRHLGVDPPKAVASR